MKVCRLTRRIESSRYNAANDLLLRSLHLAADSCKAGLLQAEAGRSQAEAGWSQAEAEQSQVEARRLQVEAGLSS